MANKTSGFDSLSRETIRALLGDAPDTRLSIYLPTHPSGPETELDRTAFSACLREARERLIGQGQSEEAADAFLKPVRKRLDDPKIWKHLGNGLAVFVAPGRSWWIRADVSFSRRMSVGSRFRVAPLVLALPRAEHYFVLALSIKTARLIEVSPGGVRRVRPDGMPENLDQALGLDQFDTGLQGHSAGPRTQGRKARIVHGHGGDDEEHRRTSDLRAYLRAVADGLRRTVSGEPLVLASVAEYFPVFRDVFGDDVLVTGIHGSPDSLTDPQLAEAARHLLAERESARTATLLESYRELPDRRRVTASPHAVVAAAVQGHVEILFVDAQGALWGTLAPDLARTKIHEQIEPGDDDLVDLAVTQTLIHGGDVVVVAASEMPGPGPLAAILRFQARSAA